MIKSSTPAVSPIKTPSAKHTHKTQSIIEESSVDETGNFDIEGVTPLQDDKDKPSEEMNKINVSTSRDDESPKDDEDGGKNNIKDTEANGDEKSEIEEEGRDIPALFRETLMNITYHIPQDNKVMTEVSFYLTRCKQLTSGF